MKVACIGSGYVGSVTAAAFASMGHQTVVVDVDPKKVNLINKGITPIFEPGLESMLQLTAGKTLHATTDYALIKDADVIFICVGTPSKLDGTADLSFVKQAARSIAKQLTKRHFTVIASKSTIPVGSANLIASMIEDVAPDLTVEEDFAVISNPEFLREGFALQDVFYPDRIVIGTNNKSAQEVMYNLYEPLINQRLNSDIIRILTGLCSSSHPKTVYFETDTASAEMIKYASNAFLAIKISYINEIAKLCEAIGADVQEVAEGIGLDTRIGNKFLQVSCGWSGSCFPKDTAELLMTSRKCGSELSIVSSAIESNNKMHLYCVEKIRRHLKTLDGKKIGILGLTFKPDTDDVRLTQTVPIIKYLIDFGAEIKVHDPEGMNAFRELYSDLHITYCHVAEHVAERSDAVMLLTHWNQYHSLDWHRMFRTMRHPYILDTRNYLDKQSLRNIGFHYEGIGIK